MHAKGLYWRFGDAGYVYRHDVERLHRCFSDIENITSPRDSIILRVDRPSEGRREVLPLADIPRR